MIRHCPLCGNKQVTYDGEFELPEEPKPKVNLTQKRRFYFCLACNRHISIRENLSHCSHCGKKSIIDINSPPNLGIKPEFETVYTCYKCDLEKKYNDFTWDILLARREMFGKMMDCPECDESLTMYLEHDWFEEHAEKEEIELEEFYRRAEERNECQL